LVGLKFNKKPHPQLVLGRLRLAPRCPEIKAGQAFFSEEGVADGNGGGLKFKKKIDANDGFMAPWRAQRLTVKKS